jgi:hypothetical protein
MFDLNIAAAVALLRFIPGCAGHARGALSPIKNQENIKRKRDSDQVIL